MRPLTVGLLVSLLGPACSVPDVPAPDEGIYILSVSTESDDCNPQRPTGPFGDMAVFVPQRLQLMHIDARGERTDLHISRLPGERQIDTLTVEGCPDTVQRSEWEIVLAETDLVEVSLIETWSGTASCNQFGVPTFDCESRRTYRYALDEVCARPCGMVVTSAGPPQTMRCDCDTSETE